MATVERKVTIVNKDGLHARSALSFIKVANRFLCRIEVSKDSRTVDGKSIMSLLRLGAGQGMVLRILADGEDAADAVEALAGLVEDGFGEMEEPGPAEGPGGASSDAPPAGEPAGDG